MNSLENVNYCFDLIFISWQNVAARPRRPEDEEDLGRR
jgi:hypothetical protein